MKQEPFFSVVIPTRNRPDLLGCALASVMEQTYGNFEVIVSDNSTNQDFVNQNMKYVNKWSGDRRLKCLRPDSPMNMADHWEFATRHACGQYVAILTDRFVMRPSALDCLYQSIKSYPENAVDCVVWNVDSIYQSMSRTVISPVFTGTKNVKKASDVLQDWLKMTAWKSNTLYSNMLPRGLNSLYANSLATQIRELHGSLFMPISPDYTSGFLLLAYAKSVLEVDLPLYMSHGKQSNGRNSLLYGVGSYCAEFPGLDFYEGCPMKVDVVFNSLVRDFVYVKKRAGDALADFNFDVAGYYLSLYTDFQLREQYGSPLNMKDSYARWHEHVQLLDDDVRDKIYEGLHTLSKQHPNFIWARRFALQYGLDETCRDITWKIRGLKHSLFGKSRYSDVLTAARMTDCLIHKVEC